MAALTLIAGLYNQFVLLPKVDTYGNGRLWEVAHHKSVLIGEIILLAGIATLVLCILPAIKFKNKLSIIGVVLSLVAIVLGLVQGTHMFS